MATSVIDAGPGPGSRPAHPPYSGAARLRDRLPAGLRRAPWRSPAGQPGYARPALLGIAALAAVLYAWRIGGSTYHAFYADAARSMSESWKAFFFGSFDPGSTITIDKLPGFLWPQALSARLFGFHPWSVTLPQVIEGVLSVLALYRLVRRWAGAPAGLLAAGAFAVTPAVVGLFRGQSEDALFTLCMLLAADAALRSTADGGRLRPLLAAAVWVGVGFQAKMLEAWAILPALALVHLVAAPGPVRRRLGRTLVAGLVAVAVSASWMLAVTAVPAADRPWIDGTKDNSPFSMVVGYNFLTRFSSLGVSASATGSVPTGGFGGGTAGAGARPAAGTQAPVHGTVQGTAPHTAAAAPAGGAVRAARGGGQNGWGKMFGAPLASQTGWWYPFAGLAAVCGLVWLRRRPRTDRVRAGHLLFSTWLAVFFLVFSAGSVGGHIYYMGVVAAPLAGLTGAGAVLFWRAFRAGRRGAWALPAGVAGTAVWSEVLAADYPGYLPWLRPLLAVATLAAVAALLLALLRRRRGLGQREVGPIGRAALRPAAVGAVAGALALISPSLAWAGSVVEGGAASARGAMMGSVGPTAQGGGYGRGGGLGGGFRGGFRGGFGGAAGHAGGGFVRQDGPAGRFRPGAGAGGPGAAFAGAFGGGQRLTADQRAILAYTVAHRGRSARYDFATTSWTAASPYILAAGAPVMPMGGFTGLAPAPTLGRFHEEVGTGRLRFVLLDGVPGRASAQTAAIVRWVRAACQSVPPARYGRSSGAAADSYELYDCQPGESARS
ncbi:ArnT family glycosyltransferase [Phaeacidiphilus oryzae]|uniref:ArnT family glycosyltransferase n=1 Tax=Phaeacidiphilus oryzae TaxID=348818 RepID=UPI0009FDC61D|nr:glycosyltransferase family 39 protein [Phaeacidiphilus oryzae]